MLSLKKGLPVIVFHKMNVARSCGVHSTDPNISSPSIIKPYRHYIGVRKLFINYIAFNCFQNKIDMRCRI